MSAQQNTSSQHRPPEEHSSEGSDYAHVSKATYFWVFLALMVLLAVTVGATYLPFSAGALGVVIAMIIATVKAVLVVLYFMHIRYSTRLTKVFVLAGLFWLGILVTLTLSDYFTRSWLPMSSGWTGKPIIPPPGGD